MEDALPVPDRDAPILAVCVPVAVAVAVKVDELVILVEGLVLADTLGDELVVTEGDRDGDPEGEMVADGDGEGMSVQFG